MSSFYMYCNYPEIAEMWQVVIPSREVYEFFRDVERDPSRGGMDGVAKLIHSQCHHPHKNGLKFYFLIRLRLESQDQDAYMLCWTAKRFRPVPGVDIVVRHSPGPGLEPVAVHTTGFIMDPNATEAERYGNRMIERL